MINNNKRKGFTIMEMLIVVAIVAILAAIAIPVFSSSLHKARVAADIANVRAYYAELQTDYLLTGEYRSDITDNIDYPKLTTIPHLDGTTTDLQAGKYSIIRATNTSPKPGYQIYYVCTKGDHSQLFGASDNTKK